MHDLLTCGQAVCWDTRDVLGLPHPPGLEQRPPVQQVPRPPETIDLPCPRHLDHGRFLRRYLVMEQQGPWRPDQGPLPDPT